MKLYTEEQVIKAIGKARVIVEFLNNSNYRYRVDDIFDSLTPIELPSDDEIKSHSDRYSTMHEDVSDKLGKYLVYTIHTDGDKWMKEQILNQNK